MIDTVICRSHGTVSIWYILWSESSIWSFFISICFTRWRNRRWISLPLKCDTTCLVYLQRQTNVHCIIRFLTTKILHQMKMYSLWTVSHLKNRKHVPCLYQVIETPVEVRENKKCCEFSQTFTRVSIHCNSIETRSTCFLFLLENTATRKRETTC